MVKLDLLNKKYDISEVVYALVDNDMKNFKNDYDFLSFLLSYYVGNLYNLDVNYKKFTKYEGLLPIMKLDEFGYFGDKLYKLYEICGKNKMNFIKTCDTIGLYGFPSRINKKTIDTNLKLKKPVSFYDDEIVLNNGDNVSYDINKGTLYRYSLTRSQEREFNYKLEQSLRKRINKSIIENNDDIPLLPELPSYNAMLKQEKEMEMKRNFGKEFKYNIDNVLFGSLKYKLIEDSDESVVVREWFYDTNITFYKYRVIRLIPTGDYYFLDKNNRVYDISQILNTEKNFGEFIREIKLVDIRKLFEESILNLDDDDLENEEFIEYLGSYYEILNNKDYFMEEDMNNFLDITNGLFEIFYDDLDDDDNKLGRNKK